VQVDDGEVDLTGLVDMHIHTAPDVRPRALDDLQAAIQAAEVGMLAIVLKSHVTCTADRAFIASKSVPGTKVMGGIVLNEAVGGLNPTAVEASLAMGARIVWLPTVSARNHVAKEGGKRPGISLLDRDGNLRRVLADIFDLIKERDAVLATGHASVPEIMAVAPAARRYGVRKVVVTHPEMPWVNVPVAQQIELRDLGVYFERCAVSFRTPEGVVSFSRLAADLREIGVASTVLATDFGRADLPMPVVGLRECVGGLLAEGLSHEDIRIMAVDNPAELLGL
jgi:hypothetical protein